MCKLEGCDESSEGRKKYCGSKNIEGSCAWKVNKQQKATHNKNYYYLSKKERNEGKFSLNFTHEHELLKSSGYF
jgi:hypothetical protein